MHEFILVFNLAIYSVDYNKYNGIYYYDLGPIYKAMNKTSKEPTA